MSNIYDLYEERSPGEIWELLTFWNEVWQIDLLLLFLIIKIGLHELWILSSSEEVETSYV